MFGWNRNKTRDSASSKREEDLRIASTVTSLVGSILGDVGNVLGQIHQPTGEQPRCQQFPFPKEMDACSSPTTEDKFKQFQGLPPTPRLTGRRISADMHERCQSSSKPYIEKIHGLHEHTMILICGVPSSDASRFSIYLQQGDSSDPKLVAMVFDVRFEWGRPVSINSVIRNHKDGEWNVEERSAPYFPFKRDRAFQIIIMVDHDCYKVAVDDQHFIEFKHRVKPFSSIDTLRINGDVKISTVQFQD